MSNKKLGNSFESEFCEILAEHGFWCHNLAQNSAGQPADVIAAKDGKSFLIDCKVCSAGNSFPLKRIEENQHLAMELWKSCGNGTGWFAIKFTTDISEQIYIVSHDKLEQLASVYPALPEYRCPFIGFYLSDWLEFGWEEGDR